jgi:two-component system sensor histidine kinase FlrB
MQMQLARLERLSEMGRMLASLAHQIRTPLASALLHASNLRVLHKGTQGEKVRARLIERLRHLEHLVTDILCFARHGRFEVEEIDVCDLLEQFVHSLEPQLSTRCVHLKFQNASSSTFIRGNREALESALQNVANNAIQAGGEESNLKLAVRLNSPERVVHISLTDTGPGIPANLHDRVFEAFFTTRKDGTGLGLATVRAIVEAHRGRVQLVSAPGEGTTVTVTLPLSG